MLKAVILLILSSFAFGADQFATISLQRWADKIVVTIDHDKGWHSYWKNPGDAGIASSFKFSKDKRPLELKAYEWPAPKRYIENGDILTIGYVGAQHFFFDDNKASLDAHITVLICKDICLPGEAKLTLQADQNFIASRSARPFSPEELKLAFESLPQERQTLPENFEYYLTRKKDENLLTLHYSIKGARNKQLPKELPLITAFPHLPFLFKREALFLKDGTLYGKTDIEWDGEYQDPPVALPQDGQFKTPYELRFLLNGSDNKSIEVVTLKIKDFSQTTAALNDFYKELEGLGAEKIAPDASGKSFIEYLFFAFLGGLILNLMPCVLPVISLKLFGLIKHRNCPRKKILAHNISYTLGVLSTFLALALVVAGLKATGEEIGWGFQLQSPAFILVMMLILFVLSLNLFGLFEFFTPGGGKFGQSELEDGFSGDFFSGVLTTILSTPCSAPFLGTALTFAFTTSYTTVFVMFFFIGLGLAFPFLLTAAFPQTLAIFPRPGIWMEKLKYFLGLSLVITVVWLYDVFVSLVNFEKVSWRLNLLFALWFFAFFFARKISQKRVAQFLVFAVPLSLTVAAIQHLELKPTTADLITTEGQWRPWSEEMLSGQTGKTVFMDFTAEWCLTCKVNKKFVLETDNFQKMAAKYNLVLIRADWTKRDDKITQFLRNHGAVGVPAYFIQKQDGKILSLGETITIKKIESYLK